MRNANRGPKSLRSPRRLTAAVSVALLLPAAITAADGAKVNPRNYLIELERLGARKPFLVDSPDVYLEPHSLNRFFTEAIYRRLQGNAYFGYDYSEGFRLEGKAVEIETLKDLTPGAICREAYQLALELALTAASLDVKSPAHCQIGICIVGMERQETAGTLPGVMVEAYLRNARSRKSFFIRYGAGSPRGIAAAIRISAEILVSHLVALRRIDDSAGTR